MKIIVCDNYDEMSKAAFEVMKEVLDEKPDAVLGLATGSSPEGLYACMVEDHKKTGRSYKDVKTYNLDEYVGIDRNDPQSYYTFMNEQLFDHIDINPENTHVPFGSTEEDAKEYDEMCNGIDIQVLGIGENGHIGFNEPGTPFDAPTHIVELTESTRKANARNFGGDMNKVPEAAISQGIGTIMRAGKILLIANGPKKADAVYAMVEGEPDVNWPASVLQNHPDVTVILDKEAASKLK